MGGVTAMRLTTPGDDMQCQTTVRGVPCHFEATYIVSGVTNHPACSMHAKEWKEVHYATLVEIPRSNETGK